MESFFIPLEKIPRCTAQEKRVTWNHATGRPIFYDGDNLKKTRAIFKYALASRVPDKPLEGSIRLVVKWLFKTSDKNKIGTYKSTKPDTDNLIKAFKDEMTKAGFWKDDAQVASEINEKIWDKVCGIYVAYEEIE